MKSVMIDLETLGTGPDACVLSIGICAFGDNGVIDSQGWAIHPSDWHGAIQPDTVKWWMQQGEAAQKFSFEGNRTAQNVAQELSTWSKQWGGGDGEDECWANDPDFDLVILRRWWQRIQDKGNLNIGKFPFHYRTMRSCRTIYAEARRLGISYDGWALNHVAHNPIDDACSQARAVVHIRKHIIKAGP